MASNSVIEAPMKLTRRGVSSVPDVVPAMSTLTHDQKVARNIAYRAARCRKSFYYFVQEFWSEICPKDFVDNWHIKYLADQLQIVAERVVQGLPKEYDLVINVPPGTTKSSICTILFPPWVWIRNSSLRVFSTSYSDKLSLYHADKSRDVIISDKYQTFFNIPLRNDKNLKSNYANDKMGERFSTSVGGTAIGMHGDIIIIDDPINAQQALSEVERNGANEWINSNLVLRKVNKEITPVILIMQRLHMYDPTANMLSKETRVKHICLPASLDRTGTVKPEYDWVNIDGEKKWVALKDMYVDGLLDPIRLSRAVLLEVEKDLKSEYNRLAQLDQNPKLKENAMFKVENFNIVQGFNPADIVASVRYWDKAGTKDGGKFTAGVLMHKMRSGRFLISDVVRGRWAAPQREARIKMCAQLDGKRVKVWVEQEPASGGKESAENTIRNLAGFLIYAERVTGAKEVRAEPYSVQVENFNIDVLNRPWTQEFLSEHEIYPFGAFKDQVDAAGGAFNKLAGGYKQAGIWGSRR